MYELVNTSTPQGLIPGTRGFATVMMTQGMSDAIRTRVESFCAYPHRASERGDRYWTENPVNYFHLMLPTGAHVVGRTAPSEFDYTGRTNRIAHVLYFDAKEMPENGGAYVISEAKAGLSSLWSGETGYLEENRNALVAWRLAYRDNGCKLRRWVDMFGSEGEEYAKRFALLLEQNVRGNGGTIYFRTSTAVDLHGEEMLGLFGDLIELVAYELAAKVTFATYSACVPSGTFCHLRGIYDEDAAFVRTASVAPWIDCENRRVVHPELLPKLPDPKPVVKKTRQVPVASAASSAIAKTPQRAAAPRLVSPPRQRIAVDRGSDGLNWLMALTIAGGAAVVILVVVFALWWWQTSQPVKSPLLAGGNESEQQRMAEEDPAEKKLQELRSEVDGCASDLNNLRKINEGEFLQLIDQYVEQKRKIEKVIKKIEKFNSGEGRGLADENSGLKERCRGLTKDCDNIFVAEIDSHCNEMRNRIGKCEKSVEAEKLIKEIDGDKSQVDKQLEGDVRVMVSAKYNELQKAAEDKLNTLKKSEAEAKAAEELANKKEKAVHDLPSKIDKEYGDVTRLNLIKLNCTSNIVIWFLKDGKVDYISTNVIEYVRGTNRKRVMELPKCYGESPWIMVCANEKCWWAWTKRDQPWKWKDSLGETDLIEAFFGERKVYDLFVKSAKDKEIRFVITSDSAAFVASPRKAYQNLGDMWKKEQMGGRETENIPEKQINPKEDKIVSKAEEKNKALTEAERKKLDEKWKAIQKEKWLYSHSSGKVIFDWAV